MSSKIKLSFFDKFSNRVTSVAGSPYAFSLALLIILLWAASGPFFNFSETWQLVINTGTTIITFLMVFLIQKSQNKESKAIQLKLNELIAADERASNRMVNLEDITEDELDKLHKFYEKLSRLAEKEDDIHNSHSIDAAVKVNARKNGSNRNLSTSLPDIIVQEKQRKSDLKPIAAKKRANKTERDAVRKNGK